jgi:hypothetical protein
MAGFRALAKLELDHFDLIALRPLCDTVRPVELPSGAMPRATTVEDDPFGPGSALNRIQKGDLIIGK